MAATLPIRVDIADLRRAFGVLVDENRKANRQLADASRARARAERDEINQARRDLATLQRDRVRTAQERKRAEAEEINQARRDLATLQRERIRAAHARQVAEQQAARVRQQMERDTTRRAEAEAKARTRAALTEAREVERLAQAMLAARQRSEREATRVAERERKRREREEARLGRAETQMQRRRSRETSAAVRGGLGFADRVGGAAEQLGEDAASAADTMAVHGRSLNRTLFQTTGDNAEIAQRRGQLLDFAARSGMTFEDVTRAASEAQGEFGALGNRQMTRQQRDARMQAFMGNMERAQNLGEDPVQFARFAGALAGTGMSGQGQASAMRAMVGMAQRGSVELGNLSRDALAPIMARIGNALAEAGPGANTDDVVRQALEGAVSELQVLAPRGISARRGGNALNAIDATLGTRRTQQALLAHVRDTFGRGSALEGQLFDERGGLREQYTHATALGEALATATGNDPDRMRQLLGTEMGRDGHVLRQVFAVNQREALAQLAGRGEGGKTGYELMRDIRAGASDITGATEAQGADLFGNDRVAQNNRRAATETMRKAATAGLVAQGDNQRSFAAMHPWVNAVMGIIPGGVGTRAAAAGFETAAQWFGDLGAFGGQGGGAPAQQGGRAQASAVPVQLSSQSIQGLAQALQNVTLTAAMSPLDAAHARAEFASGSNPPPPESRNR